MRGYGLTVFDGHRVERFDVEIVGVLEHVGPGQDIILAKVDSTEIRRSGVIAGMSGSPIYVDDKLVGALAYSWQFSREPIAGITPIEQMLRMQDAGDGPGGLTASSLKASELVSVLDHPTPEALGPLFDRLTRSAWSAPGSVEPITTPLSFSGFLPESVTTFSKRFERLGFLPVPAGTQSTAASASGVSGGTLAPGDALAAILAVGDFNLAATGTVTYVDGARVFGFGHPFLHMGQIGFPMASSDVVAVLPNLASSFKMSNTGPIIGTLTQDRTSGVLGYVGRTPDLVPVHFRVESSRGLENYDIRIVRHASLLPMILAVSTDSVVSMGQRGAGERTVVLDVTFNLAGRPPLHLREGWAGIQARQAIPLYLAVVSGYLMSNEFEDTQIESIEVDLRHDDDLKTATVLEATVDPTEDGEVHPGDSIRVRAVLRPYRGRPFTETLDMKVPEGLATGKAYLFVSNGQAATRIDFSIAPPDPRSISQVFDVIRGLQPATELVTGLYVPAAGRVSGGAYHPDLPPSMQFVMRDDTSHSTSPPSKYYLSTRESRRLDYVIDGVVKIDLDIRPRS